MTQDVCCARRDGEAVGPLARRDYRCLACGEAFALDDQPPDAHVVCPACGSASVREHWESRVRNAGRTTPEHVEDLRDRPG